MKIAANSQRALILVLAFALVFGVANAFCWLFGASIANNAQQAEVLETALSLAPTNPAAHSKLAALETQSFTPTALPAALSQYEQAAALSPYDWRNWFALGRMRERVGDAEGAEKAARRAAELAPNYGQVLWLHGNILLRLKRSAEGLAQMRRAADADSGFAIHYVNAVAQTIPADDLTALQGQIGDSAPLRAALVTYLMQSKKFDAAAQIWRTLPEKEQSEVAAPLSAALIAAKRFRAALPFFVQTNAVNSEQPVIGKIMNGGFENDIAAGNINPFAWHIADGAQPGIALDATNKRGGTRSLIIAFNSPSGQDFRPVTQLIAVDGNAKYHFEVFAKSDKVKAAATVNWEIADAASGAVLAKTSPAAINDSDWQLLSADFTTNSAAEAVIVRLARIPCTLPPCAITGKIWFDDFSLAKN